MIVLYEINFIFMQILLLFSSSNMADMKILYIYVVFNAGDFRSDGWKIGGSVVCFDVVKPREI